MDHHNRLRCELLNDALPTLPLGYRCVIPSWSVWDVIQSHRHQPAWWLTFLGYSHLTKETNEY